MTPADQAALTTGPVSAVSAGTAALASVPVAEEAWRLPVLAVLVTVGSSPYLSEALAAVAGQTRPPQSLLVVDVASRANGLGDGTPVEDVVEASGVDAVTAVRIVRCPEPTTFLTAVRAGLARHAELGAADLARSRRRRPGLAQGAPTGGTGTAAQTRSGAQPGRLRPSEPPAVTTTTGIWAQARREGSAPAAPSAHSYRRPGAAPASRPGTEPLPDADPWLWLLHDDAAPAPDCLEQLLRAVTDARSVALAGPKQVDWDHPDQLLEVGLRTTASARRAIDVVPGEVDQGQLDARSDVLAVGTVGALLSPEARVLLDAVPAEVGCFADGLTLSQLVRRTGSRVVVVPPARIRHRRASLLGLRHRAPGAPGQLSRAGSADATDAVGAGDAADASADPTTPPGQDVSFRARRAAQLRAWATFSTRPLAALLVWMQVLALARAAWRLLQGSAQLAGDELAAARHVLRSGRSVRAARRSVAQHTSISAALVAELYINSSQIRALRRDHARQLREGRARAAAPSELELRELAALAHRRRRTLTGVMVLSAVAGLAATSAVLTTRAAAAPALASLTEGWRTLWDAAWSTWAPSEAGYPSTLSPFLALMSLLAGLGQTLLGSADAVVVILLALALPLAALGAWFAAGTLTRRTSLRAWAALTWAAAPALLLGVGQGRLAPVLVHLTLPWALTALVRALGVDRRDVIVSGLVGARHLTETERAALAPLVSYSEQVAALAEEETEPADSGAASGTTGASGPQDAAAATATSGARGDAASGAPAPTRRTRVERAARSRSARQARAARPGALGSGRAARAEARRARARLARAGADQERYGSGSLSAAGLAGLLLSVIVACAPALAALIVPGPVLLAVFTPRRRGRLIVTVLPVAATAAPAWYHAARIVADPAGAGWHRALAYLLTDPGVPVATPAPGGADLLLGLPVARDALAPALPAPLAWVALALCAVPWVVAATGLVTRGRRGHLARAGALIAVSGYTLALLGPRHVTTLGASWDGGSCALVAGWAGSALSVMLAGLLACALAGADAARASLARRSFGWRHLATAAVGLAAGVAPLVLAGCWVSAAAGARADAAAGASPVGSGSTAGTAGATGGAPAAWARSYAMALGPRSSAVPVIAQQMEQAPAASRVLIIRAASHGLTATVWRADGTQLTDVTPEVLAAHLRDRLDPGTAAQDLAPSWRVSRSDVGQAAARARNLRGATDTATLEVSAFLADPADAELAGAVVRAASGGDQGVADVLARHAIGVVVLATHAGDEVTAQARAGLASTPGLEELAQTSVGTSWRVAASDGSAPARATLLTTSSPGATSAAGASTADDAGTASPDSSDSPDSAASPASLADAALEQGTDGSRLTAQVTPDAAGRTLVLAERASSRWHATLDGTPLEPTPDPAGTWRQAFTVPAGAGGTLTVTSSSVLARAGGGVIGATWALALLVSLPLRRRRAVS